MGKAYIVQPGGGGGKSIKRAVITLSFTDRVYDGSQRVPEVMNVMLGDKQLVKGKDYVVYAPPATDVGTYNIIVSGMGEYAGAAQTSWTISKAQGKISVEPQSVVVVGEIGSSTMVTLDYTGDGEITFGESEYVSCSREGNTVTVTSKAEGSGSVTITLEDGRNYKGASAELGVSVKNFSKVFSENTWEKIEVACYAGVAQDLWNLGDLSRPVTRNGKQYHYRIGDFNHYDLAKSDKYYNDPKYNKGLKKANMVLIQEEIFSDTHRIDETNSNSCSWSASEFRTDTLPTIKSELDPDFVAVVRKVVIKTAQSGNDATIIETEDDFFLMSEVEVFGNNSHSKAGEGTYLQYLQAGNSRIKQKDGANYWWWLRSPHSGYGSIFLRVGSDGKWNSYDAYYASGGVVLCVCI